MADQTPTGDSAREADAPRRRLMRVVLSAVLMAVFVGLLGTQVRLQDFASLWGNLAPLWLAVAFGAYLLQVFVRGLRLWVMTRHAASPLRLGALAAAQAFLLVVLPLRTGEISFVALLARERGVGASWASKILIAVRLLDLSGASLLFATAVITPGSVPRALQAAIPLAALSFALPVGLLLWPRPVVRMLRAPVMWMTGRPAFHSLPATGKLTSFLDRALEISNLAWFRATMPALACLTLVLWTTNCLLSYACLHALGLAVDPMAAVYLSTVLLLSSVLPIHGLGGFGPQDAIGAGLLMTVGLPKEAAISGKLAWHVLVVLFSTMSGLVGWSLVTSSARPDDSIADADADVLQTRKRDGPL